MRSLSTAHRNGTLTAKEAADILGVTVHTVYKRKKAFGSRRTEGGLVFDAEKVEAARIRTATNIPHGGHPKRIAIEGKIAASVFSLLEKKLHPAAIVIQLEVSPEIVRQLVIEHTAMYADVLVKKEEWDVLTRLPWTNQVGVSELPAGGVRNMAQLMTVLTELLVPMDLCRKCQQRPSLQVCGMCRPRTTRTET